MAKPVPDSIFEKNQQARRGLELSRGPDPRSFNPAKAQISEMMRSLFGMDLGEDSDGDSNTAASPFGGLTDLLTMAARMAGRNSPSGAAAFAAAQEAALVHGGGGGSSSSSNSGSAGGSSSRPAPPAAAGARSNASSRGRSSAAAGSSNEAGRHCGQCGASKPSDGSKSLYKCTGCRTVYYCSKACQHEAWPSHKQECKKKSKAAAAPE
uniref:MYND-type domain-containing protein n=1 Tax=Tetradesmus obliquus TaxID=3088 RepID=A0A383WGV5_TETOB|eukprot:jgi/Sobl393_1/2745/SZX76727.1